jgi:hypothetical protein
VMLCQLGSPAPSSSTAPCWSADHKRPT